MFNVLMRTSEEEVCGGIFLLCNPNAIVSCVRVCVIDTFGAKNNIIVTYKQQEKVIECAIL